MEYIVGIIAALLGAVFHFRNQAKKSAVEAKLAEARGKDKILKQQAEELKAMIGEIDAGLEKAKEAREVKKKVKKNRSLSEIKDSIKKGKR